MTKTEQKVEPFVLACSTSSVEDILQSIIERNYVHSLGEYVRTIGFVIRYYRQLAGLSLRDLEALTNINNSLLNRYEKNAKSPRPLALRRIARGLGAHGTGFRNSAVALGYVKEKDFIEPEP